MQAELTSHFDSKIGELQSTLITMIGSISNLSEQVSLMEQRIIENQDNLTNIETHVKFLEKENSYLREKRLIPHLLGDDNFPAPPVIERAHRSPTTTRPNAKNGPRPILLKFLNAKDKMKILRLSREKGDLLFEGVQVYIYQDYSAALLERRRLFDPIKIKLSEKNIQYSLRYPASLRISIDGKFTSFRCPKDAEVFL
uniref:L1 transposable element RRM domain-containing protein n=1 Tax=Oryzias melastigma TaxID=30732 RepID=A0A3B3DXF1_ORYME